ncbi:MAG: hypothetical protein WCX32_04220 [Clostridia bacterium]|jgi:hypothetical protein|nr:hypothetical protein [Clostridia bacterium]MDD4275746.1 hypothetical protein [Clostridia bacterium]
MDILEQNIENISDSILKKLIAFNKDFGKNELVNLATLFQNSAELDDTTTEEVKQAYAITLDKLDSMKEEDITRLRQELLA